MTMAEAPAGLAAAVQRLTSTSGAASTWSQQSDLVPSARLAGYDVLAYSMALSADGTTALIGINAVSGGEQTGGSLLGLAYVFTRSSSTSSAWSQQIDLGSKVTNTDDSLPAALGQTVTDVNDELGSSVALSADGNTALVGACGVCNSFFTTEDDPDGTVYVFTRSGSTWKKQSQLSTANNGDAFLGGQEPNEFGSSVALSGDGAIALIDDESIATDSVGDPIGAAIVFTRSGNGWRQQSELPDHGSVALSADGTTALVGTGNVFTRSDSTWSRQLKLPGKFSAVALSSDGATVLAGDGDSNSASVLTRSSSASSAWSQQGKLTAGDIVAGDRFGCSVALSADSTTALGGAMGKSVGKNSQQGAIYLFTRSGSTWRQQSKLTAGDGGDKDYFGSSVSLSADGATALIGADGKNVGGKKDQGAAYVFTRLSGTSSSNPTSPVPAPPGSSAGVTYFPATHHTLRAPFLAFYNANGGLKIFGLPLTEAFTESGQLVQYFERARLAVVQGHVVMSPLGAQLTAGRTFPAAASRGSSGQMWFSTTHHTLSGLFLTFWRTHNGALLFGPPISQPLSEQNGDGTGKSYLVQYCENARLEYHPELASSGNVVTLGQLGRQVLHQRGWI